MISSYHIPRTYNHISYSYSTPKWVYKKVYKHNKLTKSSLEKLKNNNDDKNTNNNNNYISEYDANYNSIIACNLPLGLLQPNNKYS
jgi:hypothetical protein